MQTLVVALLSMRVLLLSAKHLILAAKQLFLAAKHAVACMSLPRGRFQRELWARCLALECRGISRS